MLQGHGDDIHLHGNIEINFSSNIYASFNHARLFSFLADRMETITNYPEPTPLSLERRIAHDLGIRESEVMVTNGATEAIYLIAQTFSSFRHVIPVPAFSEYRDAVMMAGARCDTVKEFVPDCGGDAPVAVWMCNPNNPTGQVTPKDMLLRSIRENGAQLWIIDASYKAYTLSPQPSVGEMVSEQNVIMIHSMTKDYGIPGLRLGYVTANPRLLDMIRERRMPWSVNSLAIEAGHYLLQHKEEYAIPVDSLLREAQRVRNELMKLGIKVRPTDSHILLCQLPHRSSSELKEYLISEHGILIRDASNFEGVGDTPDDNLRCFRIAVQSRQDNDTLLAAVSRHVSSF